jgi:sRNA-binding regulator protein Hfq
MSNFSEQNFINNLIANKEKVTVFLINGVKLVGWIFDHCDICIKLTNNNYNGTNEDLLSVYQIIYKQNIISITYFTGS